MTEAVWGKDVRFDPLAGLEPAPTIVRPFCRISLLATGEDVASDVRTQ